MMWSVIKLPYRALKMARSCCLSLVVLALALLVAAVLFLAFLAGRASADGPPENDVVLILDHSQSMWERGDPGLLRIQAARLLIAMLGVDQETVFRLGVVSFGTQAEVLAPLTPLADDGARRQLAEAVAQAAPMGWTDTNRALEVASSELFPDGPRDDHRTAVVLLTDGRPETEATRAPEAQAAYLVELRAGMERLAGRGTAIHVVLLGSGSARPAAGSAQTPAPEPEYESLWVDLSRTVPGVHLHRASSASDLPAIYHAIAVDLQGTESAGAIVDRQVAGPTEERVDVEPGLARVTFVVHKENPALTVTIVTPGGEPLAPNDPEVRFAGGGLQEVWSVVAPPPGTWRVILDGQGRVTVWRDHRSLPPTATPTPTVTRTPPPTATATTTPLPPTRPQATRAASPSTVAAAASRPTAAPSSPHVREEPEGDEPPGVPRRPPGGGPGRRSVAFLVVALAGLMLAGGGAIWRQRRRPAPAVEGTLRIIAGPTAARIGRRWDLERLGRGAVTVGGAGADVALPDDPAIPPRGAAITTRRTPAGDEVILEVPEEDLPCCLNDRPVRGPLPLWDRDEIQLGAYRLRYENVRRRRPWRRTAG